MGGNYSREETIWGNMVCTNLVCFGRNCSIYRNESTYTEKTFDNQWNFRLYVSTINIYYSDLRKYMDWSLNLATIMACFPFKWLCRPLVEPFVTLNKAEQCRHLAWESIRLSRKWVHTFDLVVSEMSSNSPSPSPPGFNNWKYFLGPKKQIRIF